MQRPLRGDDAWIVKKSCSPTKPDGVVRSARRHSCHICPGAFQKRSMCLGYKNGSELVVPEDPDFDVKTEWVLLRTGGKRGYTTGTEPGITIPGAMSTNDKQRVKRYGPLVGSGLVKMNSLPQRGPDKLRLRCRMITWFGEACTSSHTVCASSEAAVHPPEAKRSLDSDQPTPQGMQRKRSACAEV